MGGIPYKSPGCTSCKKRKVKCDLGRPECKRCLKRDIPCPGYEKDRIFVHQGSSPASHDGQIQYIGRARPFIWSPEVDNAPVFRAQMISNFLDASFPVDIEVSDKVDILPSLIVNISTRPVKSEMLERALAAVSCIYLGRIHEDKSLVCSGVQHYDIAIRHMSSLINRNAQHDDMVFTTVIFQLLQPLYCPSGLRVWLAHMAGTNALLRHCCQNVPAGSPINDIYRKLQKLMMIHSTVVVEWPKEEYQYLQQNKIPGAPLDDLFELFAVQASLLSSAERINPLDHQACEILLQQCLSHRESIMRWYSHHQDYIGGPPIFCESDEVRCSLPPAKKLFGLPYRFQTLDHARLHVLYWTALTMVQSLIYQARVLVMNHFKPENTFPAHPIAHDEYLLSEHYAGEICRAIPFCLQPKMRLAGARIVIPVLPQIFKPYIQLRDEKKFQWCQAVSTLLNEIGFHMADHLRGTAGKYWALSKVPNMNYILSLSQKWEMSADQQFNLPGAAEKTTAVEVVEATQTQDTDKLAIR